MFTFAAFPVVILYDPSLCIRPEVTNDPATVVFEEALSAIISPPAVMRRRSAGELWPLAVVLKISRPGMSLVPGVPSTWARINAASTNPVPSFAKNNTVPTESPDETIVGDVNVPRDLADSWDQTHQ